MRKILIIILFVTGTSYSVCQENEDSADNKYFYFFNTNPYSAEVIYKDSLFGLTPIRFFTKEKLDGYIKFRKENYKEKLFNLSGYNFNSGNTFELEPVNKQKEKTIFLNKETQFKTKRNTYTIGTFGLGALAGVITTIKFKNIANKSYDIYTATLDKAELDKSRRYDIYSAISLIAMEAAIGGLIYFLFIDK